MLLDVEVHVVGVKRVRAGTEDGGEPPASRRPYRAKVGRFVRASLPLNEDTPFVGERDRHEVDRQSLAWALILAPAMWSCVRHV